MPHANEKMLMSKWMKKLSIINIFSDKSKCNTSICLIAKEQQDNCNGFQGDDK